MSIERDGYTWYEVARDYESRKEAVAEAKRLRRKDARHSRTRVLHKKKSKVWTVVQAER